ncbi:prepilin-type N-terminal cleavage/methylation domain-containing protein, partial [Acinetobacter johnsonii]
MKIKKGFTLVELLVA